MAPRSPLSVSAAAQSLQWLPKHVDLESLVGRYGTLVLATVSALAAVGTFLGWAIANGMLGPSQRIGLGLIVAAGLAVGGLRLRTRERSFGASLLGLSLAITLVCAWGAGPSLHLVPEWGAFVLAALAATALAVFAHREDDEPLWSVGFSGAAIAPFVTASGKSNLVLLTAYGVAVLSLLCYLANLVWPSVSCTTLGTIGFAWAVLATLGHLASRPAYEYSPFVTQASAVAAITLFCVTLSWRLAQNEPALARVLAGGALGWAFIWVHQELALAFNPTVAILLRVTYYAATSVAAVGMGRARHIPLLRHLGLGLAVLAAGTALYGARNLDEIGARVGADLVAAVFLLAIAYWYRRPGGQTATV